MDDGSVDDGSAENSLVTEVGRVEAGPGETGAADDRVGGKTPGADGAAASRTIAWVLAGCALLAVLATLGLALANPDPSRHVRGLLVTADLMALLAVGTAWLRVVLAVGAPRSAERIE